VLQLGDTEDQGSENNEQLEVAITEIRETNEVGGNCNISILISGYGRYEDYTRYYYLTKDMPSEWQAERPSPCLRHAARSPPPRRLFCTKSGLEGNTPGQDHERSIVKVEAGSCTMVSAWGAEQDGLRASGSFCLGDYVSVIAATYSCERPRAGRRGEISVDSLPSTDTWYVGKARNNWR